MALFFSASCNTLVGKPSSSPTSNLSNSSTFVPVTSRISSAAIPPPSSTIDISTAKKNELFIARIVSADLFNVTEGITLVIQVGRFGDNATYNAVDNTITFNNPDGSQATGSVDMWFNTEKNETPIPSAWWDTKALVMLNDQNGNPYTFAYPNTLSGVPGTMIFNFPKSDPFVQEDTLKLMLVPLSFQIQNAQKALDQAYALAKQKALDDAKAGKPYIEPNVKDYTLSAEDKLDLAKPYFIIKAVPYLN